jgi:methylthioribose-1-phosphate isomerase
MIPTIEWQGSHVRMVDQRKLPSRIEWFTCKTHKDVARAIEKMVIRGAPAIGVAAAMGLALGAGTVKTRDSRRFLERFREMGLELERARPTAVNLRWAVDRMIRLAEQMVGQPVEAIQAALRTESQRILDEDIRVNRRIGQNGQALVPPGATILTHCNAGSLATGGYGTALGVIRAAHEAGKAIQVIADETRPWLQGLRITAFELMEEGIPVSVIADSAAGSLMRTGRINLVITGADRIAANGDVANKIGTYNVAVLATENGIPFYVAAPLSTIDPSIESGESIPIEERDPAEVCKLGRTTMGPAGVCALNPAFDMTPARYVSGIITEIGVLRAPYRQGIERALKSGAVAN